MVFSKETYYDQLKQQYDRLNRELQDAKTGPLCGTLDGVNLVNELNYRITQTKINMKQYEPAPKCNEPR